MRTTRRRGPWRDGCRPGVVVVTAAVLLGACGGDDGTSAPPPSPPPPAEVDEATEAALGASTSPFALRGEVPGGYRLVSAGIGSDNTAPGDDDGGAPEPFTVLLGGGEADLAVVVVSATGFDGTDEDLDRIATPALDREVLTVENRPGRFVPSAPGAGDDPARWAELLVDRGDDVAVRVSAASATLDQLAEVLAYVDLDEVPQRAPALPDPPADLAVLGSAHLEWLLAEAVVVGATEGPGSGPVGTHVAGWAGDGGELVVLTLPADALDPEALRIDVERPEARRAGRVLEVDGRRAVVVESDVAAGSRTTLLVETAWGDHLVVMSTGAAPLGEEALVALASSATRIDEQSWADFVEAAGG